MRLCPEHDERAAMDDGELWERVGRNLQGDLLYPDPDETDALDVEIATVPCPECGETGACAWDAEGRPLIHPTTEGDPR